MQSVQMNKLTEEASFNGFHFALLAWCFGVLVIDGYDMAIIGAALPSIMQGMGVGATTSGFMASAGLAGMMMGSILFGTLADKIGRRWALAICVFLFSMFTAAAGFSHDPLTFSALRFVAGIGIGGVVPNVVPLISEYSPRKMRNLLVTLVIAGYPVGGIVASFIGKHFLEAYGWKSLFIAAGVPIVLIPFILKYLPESLSFVLRRHGNQNALGILRKIRPDLKLDPGCELLLPAVDRVSGGSVARLFGEGRGFSTLMFWIAACSGLFMVYGLSSWLVKLMGMAGYDLGASLNYMAALHVGALIGSIGGGWIADRLGGIKWVVCSLYVVAAVALMLLGNGWQPLLLVVVIVGASAQGTQTLMLSFAAQFYPASIRSTGIGFYSGVGRIGAFMAPIVIGTLITMNLPIVQNFMVIASVALIGAIAIALINERASAQRITGSKKLDGVDPELQGLHR
jgi:AAHS family benzoate transporter-like MFS transporter